MSVNNQLEKRRPPKIDVPFALSKILWDRVWKKFNNENPNLKEFKLTVSLQLAQKAIGIGESVIRSLKKEIETKPEPQTIKISEQTIIALCNYIGEETNGYLPPYQLIGNNLNRFYGKYRFYWRKKNNGQLNISQGELKIDVDGVTLTLENQKLNTKQITQKNTNLFFSLENEDKVWSYIFNIGTAHESQISILPGICMTINSDAVPITMGILLERIDSPEVSVLNNVFLNRFFDLFKGSEFVAGIKLLWLLDPPHYRSSGLFGNWYIYQAQKNGTIRRGKMRIECQQQIHYIGTVHEFRQGMFSIFNNTNISITLSNNSKILHLLGRIGDQTVISTRTRIRCVFTSTGKGGSSLKSGVSLMVRENEATFEDMTPLTIANDDIKQYLNESDIQLLIGSPDAIEI